MEVRQLPLLPSHSRGLHLSAAMTRFSGLGVLLAFLATATCLSALDLSPSYGRLTVNNAGGQVVVWDGYPESAGFNLAAWELTLNENSINFPGHQDTDTIAYVVEGQAKYGLVIATGKRVDTQTVKAGDVILVPKEASFWFYNDGKGPFKVWGGGDTSKSLKPGHILRIDHVGAGSLLHAFSKDVLAAGFNVPDENALSTIVRAQHEISLAKLDAPLVLSSPPSVQNGDHVEKWPGQVVFPLLSEPPHFSIQGGGALYNLVTTYGEYPELKAVHLSIEYGVQEPGSVQGPLWAPNNHMLYYFTKGSGRYQIVSPVLSELLVDTEVHPGQVVAIPAQYPFVLIAGDEGVEFFTFADVDTPTGSSLYAQFLDFPKEIVAAAFNVPVEGLSTFVGKRDHNIILPASKIKSVV